MMELKEWVHTPYHGKPYADSTLLGMKKGELVQIIRDYEHNYNALYEANERGIQAATKMLAETDDVAEKPRWIPVTERLPKYGDWVLGIGPKRGYRVCEYRGITHFPYGGDIPWFSAKGRSITITHWMPLPEPPKEE